MLKGTRSPILVKSMMSPALLLALLGLLLALSACENLGTEASLPADETAGVASTTTSDDSREANTPSDSEDTDGSSPMSTTLASIQIGPTSTAVFQASPGATLESVGPQVSLDPGTLVQFWNRYEEDHLLVDTNSNMGWSVTYGAPSSGGKCLVQNQFAIDGEITCGCSVVVMFTGTQIRVIATTGPAYGWGAFRIQGGPNGPNPSEYTDWGMVNCYSTTVASQVVWTSPVLDYGTYVLDYWDYGTRDNPPNPNPHHPMTFDAVEVRGTLVPRGSWQQ